MAIAALKWSPSDALSVATGHLDELSQADADEFVEERADEILNDVSGRACIERGETFGALEVREADGLITGWFVYGQWQPGYGDNPHDPVREAGV